MNARRLVTSRWSKLWLWMLPPLMAALFLGWLLWRAARQCGKDARIAMGPQASLTAAAEKAFRPHRGGLRTSAPPSPASRRL